MKTKIEIFCGTGGVGKTTLAVSKAFSHALKNSRVLIITIDPSSRLKDYLKLDFNDRGKIQKIDLSKRYTGQLDALLMSSTSTLKRIAERFDLEEEYENRILDSLSKPYGGMNEIMSMVELAQNYNKNAYDYIILDTPPGGHFLDFLDSTDRINAFFDNSFIEIFKFLKNKTEKQKPLSMMKKFIGSGIKKILQYLEQITGNQFIEEFVDAINTIYKSKDAFLEALKMQQVLKEPESSSWFLVTSTDHNKILEAQGLHESTEEKLGGQGHLIINKCLQDYFTEQEYSSKKVKDVIHSYVQREKEIKDKVSTNYSDVLFFPEVLDQNIEKHIYELELIWQKVAS